MVTPFTGNQFVVGGVSGEYLQVEGEKRKNKFILCSREKTKEVKIPKVSSEKKDVLVGSD